MERLEFMDRFPLFRFKLKRSACRFELLDEIQAHYKALVRAHPVAVFIAAFDHHAHTQGLPQGEMNSKILGARNLIFCFGPKLNNPEVLAIRPRSIGIAEWEDGFVISFMETPAEAINQTMINWTQQLYL